MSQKDEKPRSRKRLPARWAPIGPNRFLAWSIVPAPFQKRGSWG
ncbi:unnamed protein product [marine sediment metagenome]|uniref:Uncharacterized protein n=1 Tax=marine sediment metagenome TaxID=412755 RepID=X0VUT3_9ZZZZ